MSKERLQGEPKNIDEPHEVRFGIAFKPFEKPQRFRRPGEGLTPFGIPENYTHVLVLRRQIRLHGILGVIDAITDYPEASWESLLAKGSRGVEKPLGEAHFASIYSGQRKEDFYEEPVILRASFVVNKPRDYTKLLDCYAEVQLGKEQYWLVFNQNRPGVKCGFQALEEGKDLLVTEKNLFNVKDLNGAKGDMTDEEMEEYEKLDIGRMTFVWLPYKMRRLRTIEFKFRQFGEGGDGHDQPTEPIEPEKELSPVLV